MLQPTNPYQVAFNRLPERTQQYVIAQLCARADRFDKARRVAVNVVAAFASVAHDVADAIVAYVQWALVPTSSDAVAEIRQRWHPVYAVSNTRYIPARSSATRNRLL